MSKRGSEGRPGRILEKFTSLTLMLILLSGCGGEDKDTNKINPTPDGKDGNRTTILNGDYSQDSGFDEAPAGGVEKVGEGFILCLSADGDPTNPRRVDEAWSPEKNKFVASCPPDAVEVKQPTTSGEPQDNGDDNAPADSLVPEEEELIFYTVCETSRTDLSEVVVYGDESCPPLYDPIGSSYTTERGKDVSVDDKDNEAQVCYQPPDTWFEVDGLDENGNLVCPPNTIPENIIKK
jgi:hypothetical protein